MESRHPIFLAQAQMTAGICEVWEGSARERIGFGTLIKRVSYYSTPMTNRPVLSLAASFLVLGLVPALADTQIIPQVADGAGWSTTIVLTNKTSSPQSVSLSFNMDTSNSATTPWFRNLPKVFL